MEIYKCTHGEDEPTGGPRCTEETPDGVFCRKCGIIVARCGKHGGMAAASVVAETHLKWCAPKKENSW